ncbi:DUF4493 domain-containing protein [Phocaeicola sp.]
MKRTNFFWGVLCSLILSSCSSSEENPVKGLGEFSLAILPETSFSRSVDNAFYENTDNYTVEFYKGSELLSSKPFSEMKLIEQLEAGDYTVKAYCGTNEDVAFDQLYVAGSATFNLVVGETKNINVKCTPANVKVKVVTEGDFDTYFSDYTVSLKTARLDKPFDYTKADATAGKEVFLKADEEGEDLTISLSLTAANENVTIGNFSQTLTKKVAPRDFLTITLKPDGETVEGGQISGVKVTIDNGLTNEDIDIIIPDEML